MFDKLFSPIQIRGMRMNGRVIMPAMGTKFSGHASFVTQKLIDYHVARAKGGCPLNIVEVCSVHTPSAPRQFLSISEDMYIPGLRQLTDAIHAAGGKAGLQLWQGSLAVGMDQTAQILVASDMPVSEEVTLPGITVEQIAEIVDCYGKAAARAVAAGFDCVEFHCAHTYLPHSFLSGGINHRDDEYGGSFENRCRFPLECIRAIRANIPADMPLFMRVEAQDDDLEGGLTIEEVIEFCKLAGKEGVDVLDVSRGNILSGALKFEVPPIDLPRGFNVENAARIRRETGMLTVGVGRINTPEQAEAYLEEDKVDMVVMGRAQLADPEFCNKAKRGETDTIRYCIGCDQGCYDCFADTNAEQITCMRNPAVGRETECAIIKTDEAKTVLIAGGGVAGLQAAITMKERGHNPIIFEASDHLGGQFLLAGEAPRKGEMKAAAEQMGKIADKLGVEIRLNTPLTPEIIEEMKPHTVVNAIGAAPVIPPIPGHELANVVDSHDVLAGNAKVSGNVVVIGGGMVGMEVAEYLAERSCKVTDLEMLPEFCADLGQPRKICVTESIYAAGITPVTGVKVTGIEKDRVLGEKDGESVEFPCDYAVIAVGAHARDGRALETAARKVGAGYKSIGDAAMARRALNAIREGFDLALTFDDPQVHANLSRRQKVVLVTGVTGTMGEETMKQLLSRGDRFRVRAFARPSAKNRELFKKYRVPNLEIVWGDLTSYADIKRAVDGADYVLHIGAMVSPAADKYPEQTLRTNIGSTLSIIKAIKDRPDPDSVRFAYVGTVAETGDRLPPVHWGRVGDPMKPSFFDYYALSKVFAELAVYESGLKYWVSIRQTGQHPSKEGAENEPIIFHQPPNNVLEWSTAIESGICMANLCEDWVPESFWRKGYNLSSGPAYRLTMWEMTDMLMEPFGIKLSDTYDANMLAQYNFHGQYYTDSKDLDDILHFRVIPGEQYWGGVVDEMRRMAANPMIAAMFPTAEQMKAGNIEIGKKPGGTYWMFENGREDYIRAFFGSREQQKAILPFNQGYRLFSPDKEHEQKLDHGYDEGKALEELTKADLDRAAAFRGGEYLEDATPKDIYTPVKWRCQDGHEFGMSVNAALQGGHWCPKCLHHEWRYGEIAKKNPFFNQVWEPIRGKDDLVIPMEFSAYDIEEELKREMDIH